MTTEEKLNKAAYLLGLTYSHLKKLVILVNDDNNQLWEQPKEVCKMIDWTTSEIRAELPLIEKGINELFYKKELKDD